MKWAIHIRVGLLALCVWAANPAGVGATGPTEFEAGLLELINQARANPLATAKVLGQDPERLLMDLPELRHVLELGLSPLRWDPQLQAAAAGHTADMLANGYYGHDSPAGLTPGDRIANAGYRAFAHGEALGMLGFLNFLSPAEAVVRIFRNMFLDELDPLREEKRSILDPQLRDAGVSVQGATLQIHGSTVNAYLVSCAFGVSESHVIETGLLRAINLIRQQPLQAIKRAGIPLAAAKEALGGQAGVIDTGLPPLAWNAKLWEASRSHLQDMLQRGYFDSVSPEGMGPANRAEAAGYPATQVAETLDAAVLEPGPSLLDWAVEIADRLLIRELLAEPGKGQFLLNPDFTELGLKVELLTVETEAGDRVTLHLLVADYARPLKARAWLIGNVYRDLDPDWGLNLDEAVRGARVSLSTPEGGWVRAVLSGILGDFQLELPFGVFELSVAGEGVAETSPVSGMMRNQLRDVRF